MFPIEETAPQLLGWLLDLSKKLKKNTDLQNKISN